MKLRKLKFLVVGESGYGHETYRPDTIGFEIALSRASIKASRSILKPFGVRLIGGGGVKEIGEYGWCLTDDYSGDHMMRWQGGSAEFITDLFGVDPDRFLNKKIVSAAEADKVSARANARMWAKEKKRRLAEKLAKAKKRRAGQ